MTTANTSLNIDLLKAHMRFENATCEDDTLFDLYLRTAQDWIERYTGRTFSDMEAPPQPNATYELLPASIVLATLMLAAHFYEQREAVTFGGSGDEVPFGVLDLIRSHRLEVTGHVRS